MEAHQSESQIKADIMKYLKAQKDCYPRVLQIAGFRGRRNVSKGMSDIICVWKGGRFLAIEVKTPTGKTSPEQQEFLDTVKRCGGIALVARSLDDVISNLQPIKSITKV